MVQMGPARSTPVTATQPVPAVHSNLQGVRQFRDIVARLFNEPPR